MTMTPIATIADALIDFILSLLHDPAAAADYQKDPETSLANAGLSNACLADVRQVAPVIYDHPQVVARQEPTPPPSSGGGYNPPHPPTPVQQAISNIVNNFAVDNRSTIVDQSVNQNIWAHGDVNQVFDQHAVTNSGDNGAAAGHDATVDNSTTSIGHDQNIGNTTDTTNVDSSFNDNSEHTTNDTDTTVSDSFNDSSTTSTTDTTVDDSFNDNSTHSDTDHPSDEHPDAATEAAFDSSDSTHDTTPPEDLFPDDQP